MQEISTNEKQKLFGMKNGKCFVETQKTGLPYIFLLRESDYGKKKSLHSPMLFLALKLLGFFFYLKKKVNRIYRIFSSCSCLTIRHLCEMWICANDGFTSSDF